MLYIFMAAIFYSAAVIFAAIASRTLNSNLVTAIVNTISAIIPIIIAGPFLGKIFQNNGRAGILSAIAAGTFIAIFALALNKSLQIEKIGIVTPIVFGGMIFLTSFLSLFFFKEKISPFQFSGLTLLGLGLLLIIYSAYSGK